MGGRDAAAGSVGGSGPVGRGRAGRAAAGSLAGLLGLVVACGGTPPPEGGGAPAGEARGPVGVDSAFALYRELVEPVLLRDRGGFVPGEAPCVTCHVNSGTPLELEPLAETDDGSVHWTEERSRRNFERVAALVTPGVPERSRLLRAPLAEDAGGSPFHAGGTFWASRDDPEWQALARWVRSLDERPATAASVDAPAPDFEFFRTCVQRIFLDREEDRMECAACHEGGSRGFAQALPEGRDFWNERESRENFGVLMRYVEPGHPMRSRFLTHPLHPDAGGDHYHSGGRRWASRDDPEWRMLAAWVRGETPECVARGPEPPEDLDDGD